MKRETKELIIDTIHFLFTTWLAIWVLMHICCCSVEPECSSNEDCLIGEVCNDGLCEAHGCEEWAEVCCVETSDGARCDGHEWTMWAAGYQPAWSNDHEGLSADEARELYDGFECLFVVCR